MQDVAFETLPLVHLDPDLLLLEKPAGLLAVPGRGAAGADNLASRVQQLHPDARVVHRLDMATSGLMLMARGAEAQRLLSQAFEQRRVEKRYEAWVEGVLDAQAGCVDAALSADWPRRPRQRVDAQGGKPALTHWRVLERGEDCTRLALRPVTGRTHQLRVHLQSIGHPIRGDALYAPLPMRAERLLLHATTLAFAHPRSGLLLRFESAAPF